ncbi:MAG: hypothetical protein Kow00124_23240 [Anaerolineae bacterium]
MSDRAAPSLRLSRADALAVAALALLCLAFFWRMAFTDLILPRGDMFLYFYPYWDYRNAALGAGRLPLWNPDLFMGVPFLANIQAGVLYPPNWALIPFSTPAAVKIAIIGHIIWAAAGTYLLARRALRQSITAALLAAITFALGGYLTAQVEHINQLQGLAWLPWLFLLWWEAAAGSRRALFWLAVALALTLLAGHTQSAFIAGVGLGVWALWHTGVLWTRGRVRDVRRLAWPLSALALASLLAVGLAAAQLLPTAELTSLSSRSGGLPLREALTFSFRPQIAGRGLLPLYAAGPLFSEYVAYPGVAALTLALIGAWVGRRDRLTIGLVILAGLGLFFALGAYDPVYWGLVRFVPGFDLFRVPARWLVLWAFGAALLAGAGLDALGQPAQDGASPLRRLLPAAAVPALVALSFLAPLAADEVPGASLPAPTEIAIWLVTLAAALGLALLAGGRSPRWRGQAPTLLAALAAVELFAAARTLPYNDLSAPAAWQAQRPAISTLLAAQAGEPVPARYLSISDTLFDPGDLRELKAIYGPHLTPAALFDLIVAIKQQEVLAPNLSMKWGIPALDGYDGGVLPTRDFTRYSALLAAGGEQPVDGRLREMLEGVPDLYWLRRAGVRWIVTDKVYDAWLEGVYHDLQFSARLHGQPGETLIAQLPYAFEAGTVSLVAHIEGAQGAAPGTQVGSVVVHVTGQDLPLIQPLLVGPDGTLAAIDGSAADPVRSFTPGAPEVIETRLAVRWPDAVSIERVEVSVVAGFPGALVVRGLTLVDERGGAFLPLTFAGGGQVRLAHSGDVKVYEDRGVLPRARVVCTAEIVESREAAWERLAQMPDQPVIALDGAPSPERPTCDPQQPGEARIVSYAPEQVVIDVQAGGEGAYLILADAWYPGWSAAIDGVETPILRADGLFRAVALPSGQHQVVFTYRSRPLLIGAIISGMSLLITLWGLLRRRPA